MLKYLLPEQLKTHLSLGKTVEQWLGHKQEVESVQEVLDFSQNTYGAPLNRYLASGLIQEEYASYLQNR